MNARKIFVSLVLLIGFLFLSASVTQAQTTYYVNAVTGLDGYNGLSPTVTGAPGVGPKLTINNAIAAASSGDVISVDYADGNLYNEAVVAGNGATTTPGSKRLTFASTNGTPNVVSFQANNGLAAPNNTITFTGPFKFNTGLTLSAGAVIGAGNITVGGTVTRTALSASNSGTVDAQLLYTGTVNFVYNGGFAITTGLEIPPAANTSTIGAITTAGAGTVVTLSESKTMNGVLTTADELKLNGGILTINGGTAHTIAGAVTNGTLNFVMNGATSVAGAFAVPAITASSTAAQTLTLAASTAGNVSASGAASITLSAATPIGNIDNSGTGTVTASAAVTVGSITNSAAGTVTATLATTVGAVTNSAAGTVNLTAATTISSITNSSSGTVASAAVAAVAVNGNVLQSGSGSITFASTAGVTIAGTTTNSAAIALAGGTTAITLTNQGLITFAAGPHVLTGVVTNSPTFSGTTAYNSGGAVNTSVTNCGQIRFASTTQDLTFTGGLVINATNSIVNGASTTNPGNITLTGNGQITFASTSGNILSPGGITNSSNWPNLTAVTGQTITQTLNAAIYSATLTTGTWGTAGSPIGPVICSSTGTNSTPASPLNGMLAFGAAGASGFFGTTITADGAAGGYIGIGNMATTLSGSITNNRTSALATGHIIIGVAPTATLSYSIGGNIANTNASSIVINGYSGAGGENLSVAGNLVSSGTGSIIVATAPMTGGAVTLGGVNITSGTINLSGGGAATSTITINGTTNFAGGTMTLTTSAGRTMRLGGLTNNFSTATTSTDFTSTTNVTLLVQATTIFGQQILNGNGTTTAWYGPVNINNTNNNAIVPGVKIQGGNFRVLNNLTFAGSKVDINEVTVFVGGAALGFAGNFVNTIGYTTSANGFVSMNGNAAQAVSGAGSFGNFEVDATGTTCTVAAATGPFTGTFNLTAGTVAGGANIVFNNATTYPTIVKNAGSFAVVPTFTSMVNVYYIGVDQASGLELPAAADKLNNLTVATTNGTNVSGRGVVALNSITPTVNGTINVFPNQALMLKGTTVLSMNGAAITLDGDIVNDDGTTANALKLVRAAGTTITGAGSLPDIIVDAKSFGNIIDGAAGLATGLLGADDLRGTDDILPGQGGSITFTANTGTDTSSLTVKFAAANATTGVHLGSGGAGAYAVTSAQVNTAAGGRLILGANLTQGTCLANNAGGRVDVGTYTYTVRGTTGNVVNTTSSTIGTGTLKFEMGAASTLSVAGGVATIGSNVLVTTLPTTSAYVLSLTTNNLTIAGDLELAGSATLDIAVGLTLTETGSAVTIGSGAVISGPGILRLNAATPPLTFTYSGAPTITNLTISNDVNLAGTGTGLVVSTAFLHNGGTLAFGSRNLSITGTFTRTNDAGGYSATTGYLILRNAAINQASGFSIPNLRFGVNPDALNFAFAGTGTVTVTKRLYIDNASANTITHTVSSAAKLAVADSVDVYYSEGKFDVAPVYAAGINLHAVNTAGPRVIHATVWPETAALVRTLNINNAGQIANLPGARTVNKELLYTAGTLNLSAAAEDLTLVDASNINIIAGVLTIGAGSVTYGNANNVAYKIDAAYNANLELPQTVNNLTITRNTNVANSAVTINHSVTVNGELAIKNNMTIPIAPPTVIVTANGNVSIVNDVANFSNATNPVTNFVQSMVFGGANTILTVPDLTPPLNIGTITINKTANTNKVTLEGGNIQTGVITFVRGDIETGDNVLYIPAPTQGAVAGGAPSQGFTGAGPNSMVIGNVGKALVNSGALATSTEPTSIFPVGTGEVYRPMSLTFNPNFGVPTTPNATIVVGHVNSNPGGSQALPILDGIEEGTPIARYPSFYWSVYTVGSVSPSSKFDLGLTGGDFTDFDSPANVRIIRRHGTVGDINNDWLLQGSNENYDNEVNTETGFTAINRESVAGLRTGGAVFTYGLKSNIVVRTLEQVIIQKVGLTYPVYKLALGNNVFTEYVGSLTYTVSSTNSTIATAVVTNDTLVVTALKDGEATINIQAMDENNDFAIAALPVKPTSVDVVEVEIPKAFGLAQNYPNPFNPTTNISFDVPQNSSVKIVIYDMLGREVSTLVNTNYAPGRYTVPFNASKLSSGMYIYRMTSQSTSGETFTSVKKLMLVK
ncbi:MAG: T9SS type A sorting domain-containing protein [Bacteroidetes bacterium]|nr:T9SS type A sorting domain-containing protein [Bacteroidota bacterium]